MLERYLGINIYEVNAAFFEEVYSFERQTTVKKCICAKKKKIAASALSCLTKIKLSKWTFFFKESANLHQ